MPGEFYSPTQPFPTKPAPFVRQSYTEDDVNPHLLSPEQYQALRERVRNANNGTGPQGGLFVPTRLNGDAVSMPGNQGGSNWGTTAADPQRGLVFVTGVNQVAILRVNDIEDPTLAGRRGGGAGGNNNPPPNMSQVAVGQRVYAANCAACHGADQRATIPGIPSLVGVTDRIDPESLRVIVSEGRNNMRPILDVTNEDIAAIHAYLTITNPARSWRRRWQSWARSGDGPSSRYRSSPAAACRGRRCLRAYGGPFFPGVGGTTGNVPWPADVEAAKLTKRYQSGYNVMATSTKPPYTTITAYDLNTGEIKWQVPNGDDPATVDNGGKGDGPRDTGGVGARNGMVVTRTGLLFQNGKDGWARAYDVETGKVLWKGKTAGQSIGIPTMYESRRTAVRRVHVAARDCRQRRRCRRAAERAPAGRRRRARTATSRSRCRGRGSRGVCPRSRSGTDPA